jgi:hypothetical protein
MKLQSEDEALPLCLVLKRGAASLFAFIKNLVFPYYLVLALLIALFFAKKNGSMKCTTQAAQGILDIVSVGNQQTAVIFCATCEQS